MTRTDRPIRLRVFRRAIALAFLLSLGRSAWALDPALDIHQYGHTRWLFREGFADGRVTALAQTPDGYLWLGTELGLLRFDGIRSVRWQPPGPQRLPDTWIRSLLASRDGTLWIGTLQGLASWKDGTLTTYPALDRFSVNALLVDSRGTLWAGGYAGSDGRLCVLNDGRARCDQHGYGHWVGTLYEDRAGTVWATADNGLWRMTAGSATRLPIHESPVSSSQAIEEVDGALLVMTDDGPRRIEGHASVPYTLPRAKRHAASERILRDRDDGLWLGTLDSGVIHVHDGRTDVYALADGLSGNSVSRIFEDREGDVWVVTTSGVDRFRELPAHTLWTRDGLPGSPPWSVLAARDGSIWLGSQEGLRRWRDGAMTVYRPPAGTPGSTRPSGEEITGARQIEDRGLPDDGVGALFEAADGRLWVSTLRGVAYFDDGHFTRVDELPQGRVSAITGDGSGNVWVLNESHGLARVRGGHVVERVPWTTLGLNTSPTTMYADPSDGGLWLGMPGRILHVMRERIDLELAVGEATGTVRVNQLRADGSGRIWVASDAGLAAVLRGRLVTLSSRNGLPCDRVYWSTEVDDSVWLYTSCGLARIDAHELTSALESPTSVVHATVFDSSDGVALRGGASIYGPQVASTSAGRLWFLPGDGVGFLDARTLSTNRFPPPVHIELITADRAAHPAVSGLQLPALTQDLQIDYTALSLVAPEKNRFVIKLEGRDADWRDVGVRRQAVYADLKPGIYRFRVKASNNSGVWNDTGAAVEFAIAPAYYQTVSFRLACGVLLLTVGGVLYRLRLRQVARGFDVRLDERVNERTRIARELHDTLLQGFQGLMLTFQRARDLLPTHPGSAAETLDLALDRADRAIVEGRDAIQNLRAASAAIDDLPDALTALAAEFDQRHAGESGRVTFRLSVEGTPRHLPPLLRDDVYRIVREAVRNAYRHAAANLIEAEVTYAAREIRLRIRDDGRGIAPSHLAEGRARHWGLTSMRERAQEIGAELNLWSQVGAGTELELRIPGEIAYANVQPRPLPLQSA
jgi:signal transduction histidine kinase/ligand-binding sensor domain-containing protein